VTVQSNTSRSHDTEPRVPGSPVGEGLGWPGSFEETAEDGLGWPDSYTLPRSVAPRGSRQGPGVGVSAAARQGELSPGHAQGFDPIPPPLGEGYPQNPQVRPHTGTAVPEGTVSRETMPELPQGAKESSTDPDSPVSRETSNPDAAGADKESPVTDQPMDPPPYGSYPTQGVPGVRTAAELAAGALALADESTPMARSVAHQLLVKEGLRLSEPLPRPDKPRIMVVANQKGGVGKTTSTVNMAAALAQHGLRVLVVDLDPQGNASTALSIDHHRGTPSTYDALVDGVPFSEIVQTCPEVDNLFVVPATIDLAGAEIDLVSMVARESRLRKAIHAYAPVMSEGDDRMDYVLIDCPPSLGLLTLNALVAGDEMMIPIQAEYYALEGLGQLLETVEMVKAHLNPGLDVTTILLTMYDARTRLAAGVADEVRSHFGDQVLRTAIPRSVRISEAPSYGQTVMTYDPGSPGALSYLEAAREMALKGAQE
jgi:chromosome partitioning protein